MYNNLNHKFNIKLICIKNNLSKNINNLSKSNNIILKLFKNSKKINLNLIILFSMSPT